MDLLANDSDCEVNFTINENYAKKYETWRRGEEIQKLKDKYGNVEDSSCSSSSEEEDEDGKELTEDVEKQFYKTLSFLKERNPKIYDHNIRFFEEKKEDENVKQKNKESKNSEPPLSLAGYQRKVLLETGGQFSDNEEERVKSFELMSSQDQENDIKQSFKDILKDSDNEDEEEWGNLFKKRIKTDEEVRKEEEDFRQWLAGEKKLEDSEVKNELKGLHDFWTDPKLDEAERFLRDYVLNKRYLEKEDNDRIPSYDEIVHDSDANLSADDDTLNQQEEFEKKYNFRFEEPDSEFIKRYPRTLEQSMRKKDDKRKIHRAELKQRKQLERSKKDEELKRLKALKKKEIMDKIKKLQQITGNEDIGFRTEDLEGDFDPQEHDKRMSQLFNEDYYDTGGDNEYPAIPEGDEDLEIENWDNWNGHNEEEEEAHCEDPDFNMDCDYDPNQKKQLERELVENSRRRKKRKKSKFAAALEKEKPVFNPKDKTFEEYVNEYYALDYEDLIGDLPCRFKYRKVVPNDFGLSVDEILSATDEELNRWVSIKKIRKRLPEHIEKYDVKAYKMKASNFQKKAKCFPSLYGSKSDDDVEHSKWQINNETTNQKEKSNFMGEAQENAVEEHTTITGENKIQEKKKKKKHAKSSMQSSEQSVEIYTETKSELNGLFGGKIDVTSHMKSKKKRDERSDEFPKTLEVDEPKGTEEFQLKDKNSSKKSKNRKRKSNWIAEPIDNDEHANGVIDGSEHNQVKKKKKRKKKKMENCTGSGTDLQKSNLEISNVQNKKKRKHCSTENMDNQSQNKNDVKPHKKRKIKKKQENELCALSDERLRSYGLNPKKYKNKLKYKSLKN